MFTGSQAGNELWGQAGSPVAIGIDRHRQRDIVIAYRDAQGLARHDGGGAGDQLNGACFADINDVIAEQCRVEDG